MAKILFLHPYAESDFGRQSIPLSLIFTLLKKNGHDCELFDTTFLDNEIFLVFFVFLLANNFFNAQ